MKKILSSLFLLSILFSASAQSDSTRKKARAAKMDLLASKMIYPLINAGKWSGVVPVINPTEIPDQSMNFKLLFELLINNPDSISKDINHGITEICRIINLHVASGIPVKNITPVIVVHGPALFSLYNNNNYKKKYKVDNPNISVLQELIAKTGGIVQGMSGSPIIQDGYIIGAVTHVFINDPTKGHGVFIDWMLQNSK